MRQKQKGCFSLRLAVVGGNLTAENKKTVAEVAEKYGHGYVHMTSRQGIEIPFIKVEDINEVKEELAKGGVGTGVCGPRVRTITACQGAAICPSGCIDTYTLAKETIYPGSPPHASVGQLFTHRAQLLHFSLSMTIFPSSMRSAPSRQAFTHTPHWIQSS